MLKIKPKYNFNPQGYLQSFPQWIAGEQKKIDRNQAKGQMFLQNSKNIKKSDDQMFATLN
jgi:hypothetical protein